MELDGFFGGLPNVEATGIAEVMLVNYEGLEHIENSLAALRVAKGALLEILASE